MIIGRGAVVCKKRAGHSHEGEYDTSGGDIYVESGTIIHPGVTIRAIYGPIHIGRNCIIEEKCLISNDSINYAGEVLHVGSYSKLEVGCVIKSSVGEYVTAEGKSVVNELCSIGDGVVVGAGCEVEAGSSIQSNTVVFGSECKQRTQHPDVIKHRSIVTDLQLQFLRSQLPANNEIMTATEY
eukprot:CFRG4276T1